MTRKKKGRRMRFTERELREIMPDLDEPLCGRCEASFPAPGDTLCAACRYDIDTEYADLPGASPAA